MCVCVCVMDGRWPYSCCFLGCCLQGLFNITRSILVYLPSSFFSVRLVSVHIVHPYSIDTTATWKSCVLFYRPGLTSLPPITKTIQVRRTRHAGHCRRSRDELISDVLRWTPSHGRARAGWPTRTYIQQISADIGSSPGYLPEAMDDRVGWRESVKDIRTDGATWWWWWYIYSITKMFEI